MEKKGILPPIWVRGNCIGKGSFGTVCLAQNVSDGRIFAVKSVNPNSSLPSHLDSLENEIRILQSLSSPYVVRYLGNDLTHESGNASYRNLHMEYMPRGTVADLAAGFAVKGSGGIDKLIVRSYARCVLSALTYIHAMGIVHCDVKGKNVLVGSTLGVAKLADFGSAKRFTGEGTKLEKEGMILPRGSPLWMAPEVIRRERQGPESDVWSLGCTIIEMVTGKPAWPDCGADTLCRIAFSGEVPEFPAQLPELGHDFLDKCLRRELSERWTCEQLLCHPFVTVGAVTEPSPRCVLDWPVTEFHSDDEEEETQFGVNCKSNDSSTNFEKFVISAKGRIRELASGTGVLWESGGWEAVRWSGSVCNRGAAATTRGGEGREGTISEYLDFVGIRKEEAGTSSESWNIYKSEREGSEGWSLEYLNPVGGCGCEGGSYVTASGCGCERRSYLTTGASRRWWWWWQRGCIAGLGWQNERREKKGFYGCKFIILFVHLLMIYRLYF